MFLRALDRRVQQIGRALIDQTAVLLVKDLVEIGQLLLAVIPVIDVGLVLPVYALDLLSLHLCQFRPGTFLQDPCLLLQDLLGQLFARIHGNSPAASQGPDRAQAGQQNRDHDRDQQDRLPFIKKFYKKVPQIYCLLIRTVHLGYLSFNIHNSGKQSYFEMITSLT